MSLIEITDRITNVTTVVDRHNVADAIRPWFAEDAPADVLDAINELQHRLLHGEDTTVETEFLDLAVHPWNDAGAWTTYDLDQRAADEGQAQRDGFNEEYR